MPIEWVTIKKFAVETGYTEKAVRAKIERGDWLKSSAQRRRIEIWLHITWHIVCLFINGIDDPAATSR